MIHAPLITLNDGTQIPQLGLGVWQLDNAQAYTSSKAALQAGYRHIDTAMIYGNEVGVGRAVAESDIARNEIFITTKLWNAEHGYDQTLRAFDESLKRLQLETLDLYLIHWPLPSKGAYVDSWRAMVRLRDEGRVRSIGVSNFHQEHLQRIIDATSVIPSVNQIEIHPDFVQAPLVAFSRQHGIATESWSPLGQGGALLQEPLLARIAARLGKSSAQVVLRWHLQSGHIVIPRSTNTERIAANIHVFDFVLDAEDMLQISHIPQTGRLGPDPDTFEMGA
ncbi:aldo/keto reductase [Pseudomonas gingeri]|uniref:aldo/keto reductase n=1 Tax=Pseudomonas gingeri TaxID=117681 RepID=UPI0015A06A88|nr:aldo/keto reductase [Pseudomonas gingeri]NVZ24666.1 aldo/keto reductase [Pseudomonas gingeri]